MFICSVEETFDVAMDFAEKYRVQVYPNGGVEWAPILKLKTSCAVDLRLFPYDKQNCTINFISLAYGALLEESIYFEHAEVTFLFLQFSRQL